MSHAAEFDEYGHKDHGHVIVSVFTLRFILIALLICTLLTSGSAWAEEWIAQTFHVEIPQWINVCVALSIAVVKTALVVGFFMQLKYDNPMNTIIFVFTLLTVASFLGFTTLDLGNRATIDRFKNAYQYPGGDLSTNAYLPEAQPGESIVDRAQRVAKASGTYHNDHPHEEAQIIQDAGFLPEETHEQKRSSSPNRSRPVEGVTIPGLPGYRAPAPAHHAPAHGAAPAPDHKPEAKSEGEVKAAPTAEHGETKPAAPKHQ